MDLRKSLVDYEILTCTKGSRIVRVGNLQPP